MRLKALAVFLIVFFNSHFGFGQNTIVSIEEEVIVYKKIDTINLKLHVFKPLNFNKDNTYNCIVFFHGGGWNNGNYKAFKRQSMYLASRGMIAISAEYRLKSIHGTTPFDAVEDAKSAIRYVRQHAQELNINPTMIAAGGGSSGGHLAAACGNIVGLEPPKENLTINSIPNALVLFNPVFDNSKNGFGYNDIKERYLEISPLHNITKGTPPTIVFLGTNDKYIPVATAIEYKIKMEEAGSRCELFIYEGQGHGFFNQDEYFFKTLKETDLFLMSLGFLTGSPTLKK